jgi:hypothetical protein
MGKHNMEKQKRKPRVVRFRAMVFAKQLNHPGDPPRYLFTWRIPRPDRRRDEEGNYLDSATLRCRKTIEFTSSSSAITWMQLKQNELNRLTGTIVSRPISTPEQLEM